MLDIDGIENDEQEFYELLEKKYSKVVFLDSVEFIIGSDWREVGKEWIADRPDLLSTFESYL